MIISRKLIILIFLYVSMFEAKPEDNAKLISSADEILTHNKIIRSHGDDHEYLKSFFRAKAAGLELFYLACDKIIVNGDEKIESNGLVDLLKICHTSDFGSLYTKLEAVCSYACMTKNLSMIQYIQNLTTVLINNSQSDDFLKRRISMDILASIYLQARGKDSEWILNSLHKEDPFAAKIKEISESGVVPADFKLKTEWEMRGK